MIWLGPKRGYLTDWLTQQWVKVTGRRVDLDRENWLAGPLAPTTGIGADYFTRLAAEHGLRLEPGPGTAGILPAFAALQGPGFAPSKVNPAVARFYEETSRYELDAWAEWCGFFRPFGSLLAVLFSRRLQQLNVPLSALDTSKGVTNEVLRLTDPATNQPRYTAWHRTLTGTGHVIYAGFYSCCQVPDRADPCVKVVFPLPNGNAIVLMRTESRPDGSFVVTSAGDKFGDPGFYFTVRNSGGKAWARYVKSLRESIHVYEDESGTLRADHVLTYFRATFLRLHYRMRPRENQTGGISDPAKTGEPKT